MTSKTQLQSKIQELEIETGVPGDTLEDGSILVKKENGLALLVAPASTEVVCQWSKEFPEVFDKLKEQGFNPSQWFVPTQEQLQLAYNFISNHFDAAYYWSSTELYSKTAWIKKLDSSYLASSPKANSYRVRAVRCVTY